jgi:ACS family tartrate transporter-like MFS transporter
MFVRTPGQFYGVRFLLGMAEAGFFPGVIFYLTEWFPPEYRARIISRFYVALPLASTVMGSLAGGLLSLNGRLGLAGWQWLFLVEGLPPLVLSFFFWRTLPDKPADAPWLEAAERTWLEARLAAAASATRSGHSSADLRKVILDTRIWLVGLFFLCMLSASYGWTFSAPTILQGLTGLSIGRVGGIIAAMGLLGGAAMLLNAIHSDRSGERFLHILVPCLIIAVGFAAGALVRNAVFAISAFALSFMAFMALQGPMLTLPSAFFSGRASAIGYATMNTIAMSGGFIGPYWMGRARDLTGNYQRGLLTLAILPVIAAALLYLLHRMGRPGKA